MIANTSWDRVHALCHATLLLRGNTQSHAARLTEINGNRRSIRSLLKFGDDVKAHYVHPETDTTIPIPDPNR